MTLRLWQRLLWLAVPVLACSFAIAKPADADTALPMEISTGEGMFSLSVPDTDTTRSAYGGRLRVYDVHIAKMFEVTHHLCDVGRIGGGATWYYSAGNGSINMGQFTISCRLAAEVASAYGLGKLENTTIVYQQEYSQPTRRSGGIPILNITGGKIDRWMNFTRNFQPAH